MRNKRSTRERRPPVNVWMYPGMMRDGYESSERYHDDYYHNGGGYPEDRASDFPNESRRYYDTDIYEQEFGRRDAGRNRYNGHPDDDYERWHDPNNRYNDHHDDESFFDRAGNKIRETWDRWFGDDRHEHDRDRVRSSYFGEPLREDQNPHYYGRDNWAPNANRGRSHRSAPHRSPRRGHYDY